jgi:tetratricopeptide (TPR) repeat protein
MAKDTKYFILITLGNAYMKLKDFPNAYKYHADAFMLIKCRQGFLHKSYGLVAKCQMKMKYYSLALNNYNKAINLNGVTTEKLVYRKARIPKSPTTEKPVYRKAHIPKSRP